MIILFFHVFYFLGKFVFHCYNNKGRPDLQIMDQEASEVDLEKSELQPKDTTDLATLKRRYSSSDVLCEESKPTVRFSPPAYVQRYQAVQNILTDPRYGGKLKKIVDFGCSEFGFFYYLKNMVGVEELLFVDIDRLVLESYKEKTRPLHVDFLHMRKSPLLLRVLEGSVTDPDKVLENCDAVVCIELVEHLYPEPLTKLPYNIFGFIKPKVAIITTPNAEFNVLFKNMSKFRHPDHKFEWTRNQFQDWANNIITRFPEYSLSFHGIGNGPLGTEDLGTCTQMAVFHKNDKLKIVKEPGIEGLFKTVVVHEYPYKVDNRSDEEKILDEAVYLIRKFSLNQEEIIEEIPLQQLLNDMKNLYISLNDLKKILENGNWTVVNREDVLVVLVPPISPLFNQSMEYEFSEHEYDELEEDILMDYTSNYNDDSDNENWDSIAFSESEYQNIVNTSLNTNAADSTPSIYPDDVHLDDITTENRSNDTANSTGDESIFISSFSENKDSENSEVSKDSWHQLQMSSINNDTKISEASTSFFSTHSLGESKLKHLENNFTEAPLGENSSIRNKFLEPSKYNEDIHTENLNLFLESTIKSPSVNEIYKSFGLSNNVSLNSESENTFEEPKYTSSPYISSLLSCKQEKILKQNAEDLISCANNKSMDALENTDSKLSNLCIHSNKSENNQSEFSLDKSESVNSEETRNYTDTIHKNFSGKISDASINTQIETKLEEIFSDISESLPNSCSPEIMDSGYPNSNSPPDLSPEYDLSSIAPDHISDSESSISDVPRYDFIGLPEVENRDLANNNLDNEGNNVEIEENRQINDFQPLINVLENDIENENDIFIVHNGFPIWLLRILQRFNADGVGINLPIIQPPNENFNK